MEVLGLTARTDPHESSQPAQSAAQSATSAFRVFTSAIISATAEAFRGSLPFFSMGMGMDWISI
ncbi:hypothetical protein N7509_011339 [Penicillium cosmopolitanum]|uniref:Uncharacterized protein n=1 Tax=Penicillium cosmopolitanum TaxID=1131564 RepID=A0A9W9VT21_9EURO|nr:uncharacterized protein N7509_011339 [Penicillium cosmopolitanum]KAJ5388798.1 hypothetical protein N7509_011339 [Penicillium cosmopolitanum]